MKASDSLSPIGLFVYNRPEHTEKTLRALAQNTLAKKSNLYIFSDGPKDEESDGVDRVRKLISEDIHSNFAKVQVIKAQKNLGLANSIIKGVDFLFSKYETAIILEDDLLTGKHFLSYMNKALQMYRDQTEVCSITGYCYPPKRFKIPADFQDDIFLLPRIGSWGWATWKNRWQKAIWDLSFYDELSREKEKLFQYATTGEDKASLILMLASGEIDSWAIRWDYSMFLEGSRTIYPAQSLVQNIGFDNSGRHGKSYEESLVRVELSQRLPVLPSTPKEDTRLTEEYLNLYRKPSLMKRLKYKILKALS